MGGVVEEATREGEVSGSDPAGREAHDWVARQWAFPRNRFPQAILN
jgi:hypothetical protein